MTAPWLQRSTLRVVYVALLCVWLVVPFAANRDVAAQDVVPFVVASRLAPHHPDDVYPGASDGIRAPQPFEDESCAAYDDRDQCHKYTVPFISPPIALPLGALLDHLGFAGSDLLVRFVGAVALVAAMAVTWRLLAATAPEAPLCLCLAAALLTPLTIRTVYLGQSSPLFFIVTVVPLSWLGGRKAVAYAFPLAVVIVTKLFPVLVLPFLAWNRRWRTVMWTVAVVAALTLVTVLTAPASLWGDFVSSSRQLARLSPHSSFNASFEAFLLALPGFSTTLASVVAWCMRLALIAIVAWRWRRYGVDHRWALLWLTLMVCVPQFWSHYFWIAIGAVTLAVATHPRAGRYVLVLPALAFGTFFLTNAPNRWQVIVLMFGAIGATFALAESASGETAHHVIAERQPT